MSSLVCRMIYVAVHQIRQSVAFAQLSELRKFIGMNFLGTLAVLGNKLWILCNILQDGRLEIRPARRIFLSKLNRQKQRLSTCINVSGRTFLDGDTFQVENLLILLSLTSRQKCEAIISAETAQLLHPLIILLDLTLLWRILVTSSLSRIIHEIMITCRVAIIGNHYTEAAVAARKLNSNER